MEHDLHDVRKAFEAGTTDVERIVHPAGLVTHFGSDVDGTNLRFSPRRRIDTVVECQPISRNYSEIALGLHFHDGCSQRNVAALCGAKRINECSAACH